MAKTNFRCHSFNQNILFPQKRKTKFLSLSVCHHDFFLQSGNRKTINVPVPLILDIKVIELLEKKDQNCREKRQGDKNQSVPAEMI